MLKPEQVSPPNVSVGGPFFIGRDVIALTSDASVDFTPADFDSPLTQTQQDYLRRQTGFDIPQVFWRRQIHGDDILEAGASTPGVEVADAFITNQKDFPIAIRTADCVPVFIFDPVHRAIGVAHAGWKGTHQHIAAKTAQRMRDNYGSLPPDLKVVLGPCIRACCYQVGEEFRGHFPSDIVSKNGRLYVDIAGANRGQLLQAGVRVENIVDCNECTCCNNTYFSFRRDGGKAGRMISVMMLIS